MRLSLALHNPPYMGDQVYVTTARPELLPGGDPSPAPWSSLLPPPPASRRLTLHEAGEAEEEEEEGGPGQTGLVLALALIFSPGRVRPGTPNSF